VDRTRNSNIGEYHAAVFQPDQESVPIYRFLPAQNSLAILSKELNGIGIGLKEDTIFIKADFDPII